METPPVDLVDFATRGFRVSLAYGLRNSQIWATVKAGASGAEAARHFDLSRERVRQVVDQADKRLASWPAPNTWQETLPLRVRELCLYSGIESPDALYARLARGRTPRRWEQSDVDAARKLVAVMWDKAELIPRAIARVCAVLARVTAELQLLSEAQVIGAETIRRAGLVLQQHGQAIHDDTPEVADDERE